HGGSKSPTEMMEKFIASKQEKKQEREQTQNQGSIQEEKQTVEGSVLQQTPEENQNENPRDEKVTPDESDGTMSTNVTAGAGTVASSASGQEPAPAPEDQRQDDSVAQAQSTDQFSPESVLTSNELHEPVANKESNDTQTHVSQPGSESGQAQSESEPESSPITAQSFVEEEYGTDNEQSKDAPETPEDDTTTDDDLYSVKNFTI
ncbi:MAG: hypothetical protein WD175_00375, partial [Candidatus Paceibacterota bacterium]